MAQRFFVTIFAPDLAALRALGKYGLDLAPTSRREHLKLSVSGLVTDAEIKKLRRARYRVEVGEEYVEQGRLSDERERAAALPEVMGANEWLESFNRRKGGK